MDREPCRHCGRDTAAGSPLFAGRVRVIHDDGFDLVCPSCLEDHPIRDASGTILSKERLAALSYAVRSGEST